MDSIDQFLSRKDLCHTHEKKGGPCWACNQKKFADYYSTLVGAKKTQINYFNSLQSKLMYLNEGDRVLTAEGTGDIVFTGYGNVVQLDRGDTLPLTAVIARLK